AAPDDVGASWPPLVADPMNSALARQLEALKSAMAVHYRDGLAPADFDRLQRPERLGQLRKELAGRGLDGFIVPRADEHQGEYVPPRGQRLAWLTGFTGSAGPARLVCGGAARVVRRRVTPPGEARMDTAASSS